MKRLLSSFALALLLSGCQTVQIPNTRACHVAGILAAGADCAETHTGKKSSMDLDALIEFLEPRSEVRDAEGKLISPAHAAAIMQSADDWGKLKTALEEACRLLGKRCTYEMEQMIEGMEKVLTSAAMSEGEINAVQK